MNTQARSRTLYGCGEVSLYAWPYRTTPYIQAYLTAPVKGCGYGLIYAPNLSICYFKPPSISA